ncbi:hypothetical protein SD427_04775 [Chryseobacterium sp. JJR-5R]|uniref:hypothetical protein n=1 Tax=Chryseobacterium sp. JJR-5R TaxID=3093923 RepID=UPI002A757033|nr:hypothetical protein [Chryseobacterium sp. JJR-5R]WPO83652.1 hypothetical protein SD427_04775 [Chryseobacterium sp. JJR-5R]
MSRTRIVQGNYLKVTGGDHNMSSEGKIVSNASNEIRENGTGSGVTYGNFERKGSTVNEDFEISFSLKKDSGFSTVVPFGILDFEGNYENANFVFNYSLMLSNIDSLEFKVLNEDGSTLYAITNLPEIVVTARRLPLLAEDIIKHKPAYEPLEPVKVWDWKSVFDPYNTAPSDYTKVGSYVIFWDGFDNNGMYDSSKFNNKKLKAVITASKNGKQKTKEVEFTTRYDKVDWVDVKIDKNNKRIDTTLRVNLQDGGAEGLECSSRLEGARHETRWVEHCPWDKIPKEALAFYNKPPIKTRQRTYQELLDITLQGINQFWSRNSKNIGKGVNIVSDFYEVYINANVDEQGLLAPKIVYQSNCEEGRSRNFEASRILFFHEGYLYKESWKKSNPVSIFYKNRGWIYRSENTNDERNVLLNLPSLIDDYKMVSAHEIGHEILLTYGGHIYSKTHKGTSHWSMIIQDPDEDATYVPQTGEIDLMKYYHNYYDIPRTIISEFDLLKVVWLTKINVS